MKIMTELTNLSFRNDSNLAKNMPIAKPRTRQEPLTILSNEELEAIIKQHEDWVETEGKIGEQANLNKINLACTNLSNRNLEGIKLSGSNLYKANLEGTNLKKATLRGSIFVQANLKNAKLNSAILEGAVFRKADCCGTAFQGAALDNSSFDEAYLKEADFSNVKIRKKSLEELLKGALFGDAVKEENDINSFIKEKFSNRENTMKEKIQEIIEIDNSNLIVTKTIILAVGGITIINFEQQISKVIVGNKNVIEVEKATGNRKRIYIIGKEVCQSCNVLIEVKGELINLFFRIIKGAYLGRFNSEVIIKKTNKISQ